MRDIPPTFSAPYKVPPWRGIVAVFTNRAAATAQSASMLAPLLLLSLLLLALRHALARDSPEESPIVKEMASCPDVGYFPWRQPPVDGDQPDCHLCFCRDNHTALCWPRPPRTCDGNHYPLYGRRKRLSRARRSPGFSNLFFSDAAKDVFDKNTPEECEPFEASYSEGCPPVDWCIGCTVCDCNANGRWDCHVLSFCPDAKGKKKMKKKRGKIGKRQANKPLPTTVTTNKPTTKMTQKLKNINPKRKSNKQPVKSGQQKQNKSPFKPRSKLVKAKPKKIMKPVQNTKAPIYKKNPKMLNIQSSNNKIIKKSSGMNTVKNNPKSINDQEEIVKNITNTIFKTVMDSVEKIIRDSQKNITRALQKKNVRKRSMPMQFQNGKNKKNNQKKINLVNAKKGPKSLTKNHNSKQHKNKNRSKREIPDVIFSKHNLDKGNVTNATNLNVIDKIVEYNTLDTNETFVTPAVTPKPNYFKYTVDFETFNSNNCSKFNKTYVERLLLTDIAKKTSVKQQGSLTTNYTKQDLYSLKENKPKSNYHQAVYSFTKQFVNLSNIPLLNTTSNCNITSFSDKYNATCGTTCYFRKIFKKIFRFGHMNTTTSLKSKIKKENTVMYLKKIFSKVFQKQNINGRKSLKHKMKNNRKSNLISILCENFGSCNSHRTNKKLSYKIDELRAESSKIMQSVRSIKGLLKLLNEKKNSSNNTQVTDNDIGKLNAIIRDNYEEYISNNNLTETQRVQVTYIKQNSRIFMISLEKFAQILNDIVQILTYNSSRFKPHFSNDNNASPTRKTLSKCNKKNGVGEKLDRIKQLLSNYNLIQNKFMKRMYDLIKTLGPKKNQTTNHVKVSNEIKNNNDTVQIENYTQNIIKNLRKLKNLAQKLSSKKRRKREAMDDDDIVEYLLILMEHLLKQQKQLKISPANDGIDLLIEAIKTAPDIKATRKKVLENLPVTMKIKTKKATPKFINAHKVVHDHNITSNSVISKYKTFESNDEDEESSDYYQYNNKFHQKNKFKKEDIELVDIKKEVNEYSLTTISSYINLAEDDKTVTALGKTDTNHKGHDKAFEIFIDDTDDDDSIILTTTTSTDKSTVRVANRYDGRLKSSPYNNQHDVLSSYNGSINTHASQNKLKLDWVEDTQEEERKDLFRFLETTTEKFIPTHTTSLDLVTRTMRKKEKKVDKYTDPISSISSETEDEDKKRSKYLNTEYVMYKKQMNLLNSLDYGTEKNYIEEDTTEEKSNVEQFPSYFV